VCFSGVLIHSCLYEWETLQIQFQNFGTSEAKSQCVSNLEVYAGTDLADIEHNNMSFTVVDRQTLAECDSKSDAI
jgi:hypothetical protein